MTVYLVVPLCFLLLQGAIIVVKANDVVLCSRCGTTYGEGYNFCIKCGLAQRQANLGRRTPTVAEKKSKKISLSAKSLKKSIHPVEQLLYRMTTRPRFSDSFWTRRIDMNFQHCTRIHPSHLISTYFALPQSVAVTEFFISCVSDQHYRGTTLLSGTVELKAVGGGGGTYDF